MQRGQVVHSRTHRAFVEWRELSLTTDSTGNVQFVYSGQLIENSNKSFRHVLIQTQHLANGSLREWRAPLQTGGARCPPIRARGTISLRISCTISLCRTPRRMRRKTCMSDFILTLPVCLCFVVSKCPSHRQMRETHIVIMLSHCAKHIASASAQRGCRRGHRSPARAAPHHHACGRRGAGTLPPVGRPPIRTQRVRRRGRSDCGHRHRKTRIRAARRECVAVASRVGRRRQQQSGDCAPRRAPRRLTARARARTVAVAKANAAAAFVGHRLPVGAAVACRQRAVVAALVCHCAAASAAATRIVEHTGRPAAAAVLGAASASARARRLVEFCRITAQCGARSEWTQRQPPTSARTQSQQQQSAVVAPAIVTRREWSTRQPWRPI